MSETLWGLAAYLSERLSFEFDCCQQWWQFSFFKMANQKHLYLFPTRFQANTELVKAVSFSSVIHGAQGRAAHYLLKAALGFIHAAELLLKGEPSQSYLNEKLA